MAKFSLSNFLPTPLENETKLKIFDKASALKYTIDPNVSYFYVKANIVTIKIEDKNDINLDFANSTEAVQALAKLNDMKKKLTAVVVTPTQPDTSSSVQIFSTSNLNMVASVTINENDLCCETAINAVPISYVKVKVNGVEVNSGGKEYPFDCYFSNDGGVTARTHGEEKYGDLLYWNRSVAGYHLDERDLIDFEYIITKS